ncbi:MAG TPA: hypothetical protein VNS46_21715 [Nocardioides sp.]|nr:hypothetical protein [Nocardioides sp.]
MLAWLMSCLVMVGAMGHVVLLTSEAPVADAAAWVVIAACFVPLYSLPFALVGVPLVHLVCRRVGAQWVHVVVAGLAGLLPLAVAGVMTGEWVWGVAPVGACTALGRLAVVPLVWRRRDSARTPARG